ncbi:hypothetical protein U1Q18_007399 [Sarracenia purpurea var. burkii]
MARIPAIKAIAEPTPVSLRGGGQSWHGGRGEVDASNPQCHSLTVKRVDHVLNIGVEYQGIPAKCDIYKAFKQSIVKCAKAQPVDTQ